MAGTVFAVVIQLFLWPREGNVNYVSTNEGVVSFGVRMCVWRCWWRFFFFWGGGSLSQKRSGGRSRRKEKMKEGLAGERETQRCAIRSAGGGEETVEKIW